MFPLKVKQKSILFDFPGIPKWKKKRREEEERKIKERQIKEQLRTNCNKRDEEIRAREEEHKTRGRGIENDFYSFSFTK